MTKSESHNVGIDPGQLALVAQLDAVVDADVEAFRLNMVSTSGPGERKAALRAILESLYPGSVPPAIRGQPERIRELAGARPRARMEVTCWAREGGHGNGGMTRVGGPADDVERAEGDELYHRVRRLLAARIVEEIRGL